MFRRPGEPDFLKEQAEEESQRMAERLQEIFARKRAEDLAGGGARTRGYATRVLRPRIEELRELVRYGLSIREISRMLTESGVEINYHSLRNFLKKHMPAEYAEYLSVEAVQPIPQHLADAPPSPGEFDQNKITEPSKPASNKEKAVEPVATKKSENISDLKAISGSDVDTSNYEQAIRRNEWKN